MDNFDKLPKRGNRMWNSSNELRVKICRIESLEVAYEAAAIGIHALGYHVMKPSDALIKARYYREIIDWLPQDVANVMVTRLEDVDVIVESVHVGGFDSVQIQNDIAPAEIDRIRVSCRPERSSVRETPKQQS